MGENTPLHYAIRHPDADKVRWLLDHGADIEAEDENGLSPLMLALNAGHFTIASLLVEKGADVNEGTGSGMHKMPEF
jgi:ankyrin repeat protein